MKNGRSKEISDFQRSQTKREAAQTCTQLVVAGGNRKDNNTFHIEELQVFTQPLYVTTCRAHTLTHPHWGVSDTLLEMKKDVRK